MITRLFITSMIATTMAFMSVSCQRKGVQPVRKASTEDSSKRDNDLSGKDSERDPIINPITPGSSNVIDENEIQSNSFSTPVAWDGLSDVVNDSNLKL